MRTVFVLFDSLNRHALGAYGGTAIATPNFDRFAAKGTTFDGHYVGSLPCMPARRDMHTGRLNFMHRSWGPLEPFDESFPKILSRAGTYTHLISDHLHYFEDGGAGYANAFDSWDFVRGQEYDPARALVAPPLERYREIHDERHYPLENNGPETLTRFSHENVLWKRSRAAINREEMREEVDFPTAKCFASAFDFLDMNRTAGDWFLQLECFDPHEPFMAPERFKKAYETGYSGKILDWPHYEKATNSAEEIAEIRGNYAALVTMCDEYFGKLLDYFDAHDLWGDTALILSTDHGFLLSEHEWWGKNRMPYYEEISHIPLMAWVPGRTESGARRQSLTQTPDLMPTFLELHGCDIPPTVTAQSILPLLEGEMPLHETVALGMFAGPISITDGRFSYFLYPDDPGAEGLNLYTLAPSHLMKPFDIHELQSATLAPPFDFTKGVPLLKVPLDFANSQVGQDGQTLMDCETALYDLRADPGQSTPIQNPEIETLLKSRISDHFAAHDAPAEIFRHFGLQNRRAARAPVATPAAQ